MNPAFLQDENAPVSNIPAEPARPAEAGTQREFALNTQCTATSWPVVVEHVLLYSVPNGLLYQVC